MDISNMMNMNRLGSSYAAVQPNVFGGGGGTTINSAGSADGAVQLAANKAEDSAFANLLRNAYNEGDRKELREACEQFESIMMSMMFKQMRATVPESSFAGTSQAQDIFNDMLDDELMNRAGQRGIGLADMLYKQLSQRMDRTFE